MHINTPTYTKQQLDLHRNKAEEGTLQALRTVKHYLRNKGAQAIGTGPITISKNSHAQYETYLDEKRKSECRMMETDAARKEELEKKDKLAEVERDIGVL